MFRVVCLVAVLCAAAVSTPAVAASGSNGAFGSDYVPNGKCGAFPRAVVTTPPWACLAVVAGPADGFTMPRSVIEVSKRSEERRVGKECA